MDSKPINICWITTVFFSNTENSCIALYYINVSKYYNKNHCQVWLVQSTLPRLVRMLWSKRISICGLFLLERHTSRFEKALNVTCDVIKIRLKRKDGRWSGNRNPQKRDGFLLRHTRLLRLSSRFTEKPKQSKLFLLLIHANWINF